MLGGLEEQGARSQQLRFHASDLLPHVRDLGDRRRVARGLPLAREADGVVAGGLRDAQRCGGDERGEPRRLLARLPPPSQRVPHQQVSLLDGHILEIDVVGGRGAHADDVPRLHHAHAGEVAVDRDAGHVGVVARVGEGRVGEEVGQGRRQGCVRLVAVQPPAPRPIRREGRRGPAPAARGAHLRLRGGVVDQRAILDNRAEDACAQLLGPHARRGLAAAGHQMHADRERCGAVALRDGQLGQDDVREPVAAAAVLLRHGRREVAAGPHLLEVFEREAPGAVVLGGASCEAADERLQLREQSRLRLGLWVDGVGVHRARA